MDVKTKYKAKKIKAIFFDIDDTLRIKDTGYMPESIKKVFAALKKKGIITGLASGRALYGVVPEIKALQPDYFVTINGAYVVDSKGQEIYTDALPVEVIEKYVAWCHDVGIEFGFAGGQKPAVSKRVDLVDNAISPVYGQCDVEPDFYKHSAVYHMWTFEDQGDILQLSDELLKDVRLVRWHPNSSDVIKNGISKASGVAHVLEKIRIGT